MKLLFLLSKIKFFGFTLINIHIGLTELSGPRIPQAKIGVISSINIKNVVKNPS